MGYSIFNSLKKLHSLKNEGFSEAHHQFRECMLTNFLLKTLDSNTYHIKSSVGVGTLALNWWVSICDNSFYMKMYNITDKRKVSAKIGYYIAYLFNDDNTKMYLCITQASQGITSISNTELMIFRRNINDYLLNNIKYPDYFTKNIDGKLSQQRRGNKAADYEEGTLLAIEYDLTSTPMNNKQFITDLKEMRKVYNQLIKILLKKSLVANNSRYDFVNRVITNKDLYAKVTPLSYNKEEDSLSESENNNIAQIMDNYKKLTPKELNNLNKRKPEFKESGKSKRLKTDPKLIKNALMKNDYTCQSCGKSVTFKNSKGNMYMEGHHLIPVSYQTRFNFGNYNLDNSDNIVCLCPECHRALHYGSYNEIINRLIPLYEDSNMKLVLKKYGVANNFEQFINLFTNYEECI